MGLLDNAPPTVPSRGQDCGEYGRGEDSRHEEDHNEEYHVEEESGEIYDEDVRGKDSCNQEDDHEEYRREDMTAARRNSRRTVTRMVAGKRTTRSTAVRKAVARPLMAYPRGCSRMMNHHG